MNRPILLALVLVTMIGVNVGYVAGVCVTSMHAESNPVDHADVTRKCEDTLDVCMSTLTTCTGTLRTVVPVLAKVALTKVSP